jgi:DNA-binding transcriptional MerR regulator/effector-binding domain-containing protein
MFSIGEFSRITGLSVKTLRHYHEKGLLPPPRVNEHSGYRYYDPQSVERARIVTQLRAMEFGLAEIKDILENCADESDVLEYLERHKQALETKIHSQRSIVHCLEQIIAKEREARRTMEDSEFTVREKKLEPLLMAGVRMKGKYSDCGKGFAQLGRRLGRFLCGKPFCLYYDGEYRANDADFEACFPVRAGAKPAEGIAVRELPGGPCVCLIHQGPYAELGRSYEKLLDYIKAKGYKTALPSREVFLKGPGMIFKGNPKKYLTEIQILLAE